MARKYIDCREVPSEMNCTVGIAADSEEELMEAAVQHAVAVHSDEDTPELRAMIHEGIRETEAAAVSPIGAALRGASNRSCATEARY